VRGGLERGKKKKKGATNAGEGRSGRSTEGKPLKREGGNGDEISPMDSQGGGGDKRPHLRGVMNSSSERGKKKLRASRGEGGEKEDDDEFRRGRFKEWAEGRSITYLLGELNTKTI